MKELVIDRQKWYRGQLYGSKLLRKGDQRMCCLGFYALACGLKPDNIVEVSTPSAMHYEGLISHSPVEIPQEMLWLFNDKPGAGFQCKYERDIVLLNDGTSYTDEQREKLLTKAFAAHNINVTFIN